jgi:short-subunit dehydrogenase
MRKQYECALITGASAGLGEEFARQLAGNAKHLILVARRGERLEILANELRRDFPEVAVSVIVADLAKADGRREMMASLSQKNLVPDLLINNAGLGDYGEFLTADWSSLEAMLHVNMEALTHLCHLIVPLMKHRGGGDILNVSSLASTLPIPDFAVYAATKAYVSSFSEALRIELREHKIGVMSLCPGPVKTEFGEVARRKGSSQGMPNQPFFYVKKEQVVSEALSGLERGRARVFPGIKIAMAGLAIGALPMGLIRLIMSQRPRR